MASRYILVGMNTDLNAIIRKIEQLKLEEQREGLEVLHKNAEQKNLQRELDLVKTTLSAKEQAIKEKMSEVERFNAEIKRVNAEIKRLNIEIQQTKAKQVMLEQNEKMSADRLAILQKGHEDKKRELLAAQNEQREALRSKSLKSRF